jgi:hypothetical protein
MGRSLPYARRGVWWLNVDRYPDAVSLLNQTLAAQDKECKVAAIVMGEKPNKIISLKKLRPGKSGVIQHA